MSINLRKQLNILINLAQSDNQLDKNEIAWIHKVASGSGLKKSEIDELIKHPDPMPSLSTLTYEDRFEHLFNIIKMMKIDGNILLKEIFYCFKVARSLGLGWRMVLSMSGKIYGDEKVASDWDGLWSEFKLVKS